MVHSEVLAVACIRRGLRARLMGEMTEGAGELLDAFARLAGTDPVLTAELESWRARFERLARFSPAA